MTQFTSKKCKQNSNNQEQQSDGLGLEWLWEGAERTITKGLQETWGGAGCAQLNCGDSFIGICTCQNLSNQMLSVGAVYCTSVVPQ